MAEEYDGENEEEVNQIKVILIGDVGVGKTNLINVSTGGTFKEDERSSVSTSFSCKSFEYKGEKYILNIWDTIGQEKLRGLNKIFFKESKIVIFVYDIINYNSFQVLKDYWIKEIYEKLGDQIIKGVCGNKVDLYTERKVNESVGQNLADSIGAKFKETSAKVDAPGFIAFLEELTKDYIDKLLPLEKGDKNISLSGKKKKKKGGCC